MYGPQASVLCTLWVPVVPPLITANDISNLIKYELENKQNRGIDDISNTLKPIAHCTAEPLTNKKTILSWKEFGTEIERDHHNF